MRQILSCLFRTAQRSPIIFLIAILLVSLWLRLYDLSGSPNGLNIDESQNAYMGRFIFENGKDPYGQRFPLLYADKRGDYPPVIPMYFAAVGTYILGPTIAGARIILALFGAVTVMPVYVLAMWASGRRKGIALMVTLLFALTPWHISLSRVATEGTLALFFYASGLALLVRDVQKSHARYGCIALCMMLSIVIYPAYRILVPLTLCAYLIHRYWYERLVDRRAFVLLLLSIGIVAYMSSTVWGRGRFAQTSYMHNINVLHQDNPFASLIFDEVSVMTARIFYNKYSYLLYTFVKEYFSYFSFDFLLGSAGRPIWFTTSLGGLLYVTHVLLIGIGVVTPLISSSGHHDRRREYALLVLLVLLAPIPSALTNELTPSIHRDLQSVLFLTLCTIPGMQVIADARHRILSIGCIVAICMVEVVFFTHTYFAHINLAVGTQRQTGRAEMIEYIRTHKDQYAQVWWHNSGWPQMDYLYFTGQFTLPAGYTFSPDLQLDHYQNIQFIREDCPSQDLATLMYARGLMGMFVGAQKHLMITNCEMKTAGQQLTWEPVTIIYGKSKLPMYRVYEVTLGAHLPTDH